MNLLNVPKEVIEDHLFPFLPLNDVLRFRRICKFTKLVADDYLRLFGQNLLGEISINGTEGGKSFEDFINIGFSLSQINLKINEPGVLGSKGALEFMEKHGSKITKLTVDNMYCCLDPVELQFYKSLTNLVSLEIETVHISASWPQCKYPANLEENLKKLKIDEVLIPGDDLPDRVDYVSKLYEYCDKCEYLKHPLYRHKETGSVIMNFGLFNDISHIIYGTNEDRAQNLKMYDLSSFRYEWKDPMVVLYFVRYFMPIVIERGFRLVGVDTNFLAELQFANLDEMNQLGRCLQSITNVNGLMFAIQDAPNIDEIDINSTAKCSLTGYDLALDPHSVIIT